MNKFTYDIVTLIELVENRPCLWDKTSDTFKDRTEKQKAWVEVCTFLEPGFNDLEKKEQTRIGQLVQGKWHNIRDSFVKSQKKKSGLGATKKYLYATYLHFLLKVIEKDDTESSIPDPETQVEELQVSHQESNVEETGFDDDTEVLHTRHINQGRGKKRKTTQLDIDREILKSLQNTRPDEDEAFFISITPAVQKMSANDKLEFRMGVLGLIRDINRKSTNFEFNSLAHSFSSTSSSPSASTSSSHTQGAILYNSLHSVPSNESHFPAYSSQLQNYPNANSQQDFSANHAT